VSGSRSGGTKITIVGKFFGQDVNKVKVSVGGSECKATSVTDTKIECVTSPVDATVEAQALKPGKVLINY